MGQINLKVEDELERRFRNVAVRKFEARKGFLKKAIEEAMNDWVKRNGKGGQSG